MPLLAVLKARKLQKTMSGITNNISKNIARKNTIQPPKKTSTDPKQLLPVLALLVVVMLMKK